MAIPRNLGNLASGADTNGVLGVTKGGTGATSNATAPFALKGANADITSLTGLTTALSVGQGGTGLTTLTANNVVLGNGTSAVNFVAPGTSGNVLQSNGTTWTSAAPSGGDFKFIQQVTPGNGVTYAEFKEIPTFNTYFLTFTNLVFSGENAKFEIQFGSGGASPTYIASGYNWTTLRALSPTSTINRAADTNQSVASVQTIADTTFSAGNFYFYGFQNSTGQLASFTCTIIGSTTTAALGLGVGITTIATSPITAIRIKASGAITYTGVGTFRLYGIN